MVVLSPASGQALLLLTRLQALRAMARQVTVGQAARPASDKGVLWVSGTQELTYRNPCVPFVLTTSPLLQAKLRLEMEMERLRQTHAKEVESRDEEVEEIRQSCQKKVGLRYRSSAQGGPGCIPVPQPGAGSCQLGTVTQCSTPTWPQPGSACLAGPTSPSAALAGVHWASCLWLCKCLAGGVTWCPQYVRTCKTGILAPSNPNWIAWAIPQLKQMEVQLEEEYEDKQKVLREKRELESKLSAVSEQVESGAARHVPHSGDSKVAVEGWAPH